MASRLRRGDASGPAEWLLAFLQARDNPPRARAGCAAGPTEWLLVFLGAATAAPTATVATTTVTTAGAATTRDRPYADDRRAGLGGEIR